MAKRKLTVAFVGTKGIPCKYGGFETFVEELAVRLSQAGTECIVYTTSHVCESPMIDLHRIALRRVPQIGHPTVDRVLREVFPLLDQLVHPADIVHVLASSLLAPLWRLCGKSLVVSLDGFEWRRQSYGPTTRLLVFIAYVLAIAFSNQPTCDSRMMAKWVKSVFRREIHLVSYGPRSNLDVSDEEIEAFAIRHGIPRGEYFLFIGRLVPEKGVRLLVNAFSKHPDKTLVVVGSDPFDGRFERELKRVATPNIVFLGSLYGREYGIVCLGALAQIRPVVDESEGVNPATVEAMGFGTPIIASDVPQNREVLGDCAVYFDTRNERTLHEAIELIHSSKSIRSDLSRAAKTRAFEYYSWDLWLREIQRVYDLARYGKMVRQ